MNKYDIFSVSISIQDEDWYITDPEDVEKGWSCKTIHFSDRGAMIRYFISGFEGTADSYRNEISYELKEQALGKYLVPMTPQRAAILRLKQDEFIKAITDLEFNKSYDVCSSIYIVLLPLTVYY